MELKTSGITFDLLGWNQGLTINAGTSSTRNRFSIKKLTKSQAKTIVGKTVSGSVGDINIRDWIITNYLEDKGFGEEATLVIDDVRWYWQFYRVTEVFNVVKQEKVPTGTIGSGDKRSVFWGPAYSRLKYNKFTLLDSKEKFNILSVEGQKAATVFNVLEYLFNSDAKLIITPSTSKATKVRKKLPKLLFTESAKNQAKEYSMDNLINPAQSFSGWVSSLLMRASLKMAVTPENKLYVWNPLDEKDIKDVQKYIEKDNAEMGVNIQNTGELKKPKTLRVYFPRKDLIRIGHTTSITDESGFRNVCILPFAIQTTVGDYEAGVPIPFEFLINGLGAKTIKIYQSFSYKDGTLQFTDAKTPFTNVDNTIKRVLRNAVKVLNYKAFCKYFMFKPMLQSIFFIHQGMWELQKHKKQPEKLYFYNLRSTLLNALQAHFRTTFQLGNQITEQMLSWEFKEPVESDYFSKYRKETSCYADTIQVLKFPNANLPMALETVIDKADLSTMENNPRIQISGGSPTGLFTVQFRSQLYENFQEFVIGRVASGTKMPTFTLESAGLGKALKNHKNQIQLDPNFDMYIDITVTHPKAPVYAKEVELYSDGDEDFVIEKYSDALTASFDHRVNGDSDPLNNFLASSALVGLPVEEIDLLLYVKSFVKPKVLQEFDSQVVGQKKLLWEDAKKLLKKGQMKGTINSIRYEDGAAEGVTIQCVPSQYPIDPNQLSPKSKFAIFQSLGMNGIGGK